jgi:putative phosphoesterase
VHAGDFVAASVLVELRRVKPVEAVQGNMDDAELCVALPRTHVVEVEGVRIGLVHDGGPAAGRATRLAGRFPGCAAVVYAHTHMPEVTRHGDVWILNPGSPTERRRAPAHTMLRLLVEGSRIDPELLTLTT